MIPRPTTPSNGQIRIIGIGNWHRGDDAVGLHAAEQLAARCTGAMVSSFLGDFMELLEQWEKEDIVVLIDAMSSGESPGTVLHFDAVAAPLPEKGFPTSTHAMGLSQAIELGRTFEQLPRVLWVYGVELEWVDPGKGLSSPVQNALSLVVEQIESDVAGLERGRHRTGAAPT